MRRILNTPSLTAILLIRLMVGGIFLSEGIQKCLYPAALGAGRFEKIGIPLPAMMGPAVAVVEISCGVLVIAGFLTRLAVVPLIIVMCVAILSTKVPILLGREFWGFSLRPLARYGVWSMLHEARNDLCMLLGGIFLLLVGAGRCSLDHWMVNRKGGEKVGSLGHTAAKQ
jgi:putative oxidoreductase